MTQAPAQPGLPDEPDDSADAWRRDAELVAAAGRGDSDAMASLYHQYRDWVAALAYRFTGDRDQAMDVLQETFVYLVRRAPTLTLSARLTTFLYPAVKHLAEASRRKSRRGSTEAAVEHAEVGFSPWRADEALSKALACLSADHREVVMMRYGCGMAPREIGVALGVPEGTVKSRLHAGMRKLEEVMTGEL